MVLSKNTKFRKIGLRYDDQEYFKLTSAVSPGLL